MKVNENLLKVSAGYVPVDKKVKLGDDVIIRLDGQVTKTEYKDNQDGTVNRIITVKGIVSEVLGSDGESRRKATKIYR